MPRIARVARSIVAATLIAAPSLTAGASPALATHPGANGRLAINCSDGLWSIEADGTDAVLITDDPVIDPAWSPGGTAFAFSRQASANTVSLWTMQSDGSQQVRRTWTVGNDLDADWSPSGAYITFASDKHTHGLPPGETQIWAYGLDIGESRHLISPFGATDPAWSPDGTVIAFALEADHSIWFNRLDWYEPWSVATAPAGSSDESPDWFPDGSRYLFVRLTSGVRSVWVVDADGSNLERLTDATLDVLEPRYSPDGTTIAFLARPAASAGTDANYGFWTMAPDGSNQVEHLVDLECDHLTWQPVPDFPLVDARFSVFRTEIIWAYDAGITTGCSPERFCPYSGVTREQMASFLARALDLPPATTDHFGDDDASIHEEDINRIAEAGITTGCQPGLFCPTDRVTRAQMASFLARALELPPATADHFTGDEDSIHEEDINRIAEAGITTGCQPGLFCPYSTVLRGQMAAFLYRAAP